MLRDEYIYIYIYITVRIQIVPRFIGLWSYDSYQIVCYVFSYLVLD